MGRKRLVTVDYRERLGQVIAEVRVLAGLTQAQFAVLIKRSEPTISRWEGHKTIPSAVDIRVICEKLSLPPDLFIFPPDAPISPVQMRLRRTVAEGVRQAEGPPLPVVPPHDDKRKRPRL